MSDDYRWCEVEVAGKLGLTVREVKRLRKEALVPIEHVEMVAGKPMINEAGLMALCAVVGIDPIKIVDPSKKIAPAMNDVVPQPVELVVDRLCPNPTWVLCRVEGILKKCRVRNNLFMHRGKKFLAVPAGDDFQEVRVRA